MMTLHRAMACVGLWVLAVLSVIAVTVVCSEARAQGTERQTLPGYTMEKDAKMVLITGRTTGESDTPSFVSVILNGIDFTVTVFPVFSASGVGESASPIQTCRLLRKQITDFRLPAGVSPEFEAACLKVAGGAALLLIQPNPDKYESDVADDDGQTKWLKAKRRHLRVKVYSSDDNQELNVVK